MAEARETQSWDAPAMLAYVIRRIMTDKAKPEDMHPFAESKIIPVKDDIVGKLQSLKSLLPKWGEHCGSSPR